MEGSWRRELMICEHPEIVNARFVMKDEHAVPGRSHIDFDTVGTVVEGEFESLDGVVGRMGRGPSVPDHQRSGPAVEDHDANVADT